MRHESMFLFARPSFCEGVGRLVDFADALTEYNASASDEEADLRALRQDWLAVGRDLAEAVAGFAENRGLPQERLFSVESVGRGSLEFAGEITDKG